MLAGGNVVTAGEPQMAVAGNDSTNAPNSQTTPTPATPASAGDGAASGDGYAGVPRRRVLRPADGLQGVERHARVPGGDLRPGRLGDDVQGRGGGGPDLERDALRPRRRRLDARRAPALPRPRAPSRPGASGVNCYHLYPAHAAFGGYKKSGIGRENHKMMLDHYQQTKNMLVSYSKSALGFF